MPGSRRASMLLPAPGGPMKSRLWPPAAAISSARRASACPRTSARSGAAGAAGAGRGAGAAVPSERPATTDTASSSEVTGSTVSPPTIPASPAFACGSSKRSTPSRRACAAMGRMPRTGLTAPSRASSPTTTIRSSRSRGNELGRGQLAEGDGQVERRTHLAHVRGREVDGHLPLGKLDARVADGAVRCGRGSRGRWRRAARRGWSPAAPPSDTSTSTRTGCASNAEQGRALNDGEHGEIPCKTAADYRNAARRRPGPMGWQPSTPGSAVCRAETAPSGFAGKEETCAAMAGRSVLPARRAKGNHHRFPSAARRCARTRASSRRRSWQTAVKTHAHPDVDAWSCTVDGLLLCLPEDAVLLSRDRGRRG